MFDTFGEIGSAEELNTIAENLVNEGDIESLKALAKENGIEEEYALDFANGDSEIFVDTTTAAGDYLFLVPRSASDIRNEGRLQHHCVGRAGYIEKMDKRESFIVFLRKTAEPEVPYYTIETDGTRIIQAYGAYDRKPDWDTVNKLLQKWIREVRKRKARLELKTAVG